MKGTEGFPNIVNEIDNLLVIGKWSHGRKCAPSSLMPVFSFEDKTYKSNVSMRKELFMLNCK